VVNDRLRIGDAEREAAARELGEHFALGRITVDEHAERLEQIWSARTEGDLAPAFRDLPRPRTTRPRADLPAGPTPASRPSRWPARPHVPLLFKVLVAIVAVWWGVHHPLFLLVAALVYVVLIRRLLHRRRWRGGPPWDRRPYQTGWH
jgi:Flp pilus assembly protein TadB